MENDQSAKQKKIALAQSEHAMTVIELIKDCITQKPLVAKTEWETIVNTVAFDAQSQLLLNVVDYIDRIKKGSLHEPKP